MAGNLLGEAIDFYVANQIRARQNLMGKGLNNPNLTNSDLNLINNKNAWLKLASGVYVGNPHLQKVVQSNIGKENGPTQEQLDRLKLLPEERLRTIGLDINEMAGLNLAKKTVLFNTLSEWDSKEQKYNFRSGIVNTKLTKDNVWNSNNSYGLGSPSKGLQPAPGLISLDIENLNRGSIKEASIEIKCFNKIQFEILDLVYLRLGYHMLIEWGWDKYISADPANPYQQVGNTVIEEDWFEGYNTSNFNKINQKIKRKRIQYEGNYDGFIGKVSNYDWNMESDGSFTVNLKLISTGDVIESLKTNLAISQQTLSTVKTNVNASRDRFEYKADSDEFKSIIVSKAAESTIHYDLFSDQISKDIDWGGQKSRDYFNIFQTNYKNYTAGKSNDFTFYDKNESGYPDELKDQLEEEGFKEALDDHLGYFITFHQFLNKLRRLAIPSLSDDMMISINSDRDSNICSVFPNLISLDPRVCYVKPFITEGIANNGKNARYVDTKLNIVGNNKLYNFGHIKKTVNPKTKEESVCVYGKIMNIYLNYDFIGQCLESSRNDAGDITLFALLKSITDGVNKALGNTTNLEVTLRNDSEIVIIDQNPIAGLSSVFPQLDVKDVTDFNLFGFNTTQEQVTSNFVKDFSFTSKLTPKTSAQIAIGAAAGGLSTKNQDISGFANWNKGLEDNYAYGYQDPEEIDVDKTLVEPTGRTITRAQIRKIKKAWDEGDKDEYKGLFNMWSRDNPKTFFGSESGEGYREVDKCPLTGGSYQDYTWEQYATAVDQVLSARKRKKLAEEADQKTEKTKWSKDYFFYLVRAFNGISQAGENKKARYLAMDDKFIKEGMKSFQAYKSVVNNIAFQNQANPSNQTGFIPLDLSVTCDGIGGFKIYNSLNINNDVESLLPYQYRNINNFLIQKVNHTISDNDWETELQTLSIPKVEPPNPNAVDLYKITAGSENPYNPSPDFTPTKQPWSAVFISYVVNKQAGVPFPVATAHRIYANSLYDAAAMWRNETSGGKTLQYKRVTGKYFGWKVISPFRVSRGVYEEKIQDWFMPKRGDIFVYNRSNNTNTFPGGNWQGATHGDIVTEVNTIVNDNSEFSFSYKAIGGNLSNTSKFSTIGSPSTTTYTKELLNEKASNRLFVVLRPPNNKAEYIANAAVEEKNFWKMRKETEANKPPSEDNELFKRMTEYWALCGIKAPQWGVDQDPAYAAKNQQKDNFT
tara:strand:+ start:5241 stop:8864 length:3624 start_codon:yes stop_codon:yes gene_type:complete